MSVGIQRLVRKIEPVTANDSPAKAEKFLSYMTTDHIILLGDPGSGKTYTFKDAKKEPNSRFISVRNFLTLDGEKLEGKILYLDGLDEYRSRGDGKNMIINVVKQLHKIGCQSLRLSCRSADWFGDSDLSPFREFFGEQPYVVLNLEPLTGEEIADILEQKNIEASRFIESATTHNLEALLANPQTLIMLADVVGHGKWPSTKKELYEKSAELLLSEPSALHAETDLGQYTANELTNPAGAICASILLSDSAGISISNNQTNSSYPSFRDIHFKDKTKVQACLTRRLFTATHQGSNNITCQTR